MQATETQTARATGPPGQETASPAIPSSSSSALLRAAARPAVRGCPSIGIGLGLIAFRTRAIWSSPRGPCAASGRQAGGGGPATYRVGRPVSTSSPSPAPRTRAAPCRLSPSVAAARGSNGEPGTAITWRPCFPAIGAEISGPGCSAASTTTTPRAISRPAPRRSARLSALSRQSRPRWKRVRATQSGAPSPSGSQCPARPPARPSHCRTARSAAQMSAVRYSVYARGELSRGAQHH